MIPEASGLAPAEAVAFFERKGLKVGFDWRDTWAEEHAFAFTVAKATRLDILSDIKAAVGRALAEGKTRQQFAAELTPILQAKGWWGRQTMTDPVTGDSREVQLGSPRRLGIIFDTNLRTAYAAGQWQRIEAVKAARPWLRYVAIADGRTRPQHLAWHGTILPVDDPFWRSHYPPNGWRCRCTIQQLSDRDLKRRGYTPSPAAPPTPSRPWVNDRTGETVEVPVGIDPGFGHHVGLAGRRAEAAKILAESLAKAPADIGAAAAAAAGPDFRRSLQAGWAEWAGGLMRQVDAAKAQSAANWVVRTTNERRIVGALTPDLLGELAKIGQAPASAAIEIRDKDLLHLVRDAKAGRGLSESTILGLVDALANPQAVLWDRQDPALIYVLPLPGSDREKLVVRLDQVVKDTAAAGRGTIVINRVASGGTVGSEQLLAERYSVLGGKL